LLLLFPVFFSLKLADFDTTMFTCNPIFIVQMPTVHEFVHHSLQFLQRQFFRIYQDAAAIRNDVLGEGRAQKTRQRSLFLVTKLGQIDFELLTRPEQNFYPLLMRRVTSTRNALSFPFKNMETAAKSACARTLFGLLNRKKGALLSFQTPGFVEVKQMVMVLRARNTYLA
jgi:hypothetical protein